jgi:hypothetical protein
LNISGGDVHKCWQEAGIIKEEGSFADVFGFDMAESGWCLNNKALELGKY